MQHAYENRDAVLKDIPKIRELFGNKNATEAQFKGMFRALGLMVLYCPEDLRTTVDATLAEAVQRETFFQMKWKSCDHDNEHH